MAYGKYPFPFVDLIQALISHTAWEGGSGKNMKPEKRGRDVRVHIDWTQWLLGAFLNLGDKHIGKRRFPVSISLNALFIENPIKTVSLENSEEHGWKFSGLLLNSGF